MLTSDAAALRAAIGASPALGARETGELVAALTAAAADVRFVGGCVRDLVLGGDVGDVDIATPDRPEVVEGLLRDRAIDIIPTGLDHGTLTAVHGGREFQITTLRVDRETDGRHAVVAFTDDWETDARRRDFTINAMSLRADGTLFDYAGGLDDLALGRIRFVGDADRRVDEDRLRVLRYFRFLARFSRGEPDRDAVAACRRAAGSLARLAAERVRAELLGLLAAASPLPALLLMRDTGVLGEILPEAGSLETLDALTGIDDRDPLRRLAALAPASGGALGERLKLCGAMRARLEAMAPAAGTPEADWSVFRQRQFLYDRGRETFRDLVLLAWASDPDRRAGRWRAMLETANRWEAPRLPVRGSDALETGLEPGRGVGEALASVESWWRGEDFVPGREACLARLREAVAHARADNAATARCGV